LKPTWQGSSVTHFCDAFQTSPQEEGRDVETQARLPLFSKFDERAFEPLHTPKTRWSLGDSAPPLTLVPPSVITTTRALRAWDLLQAFSP